MSLMSRGAISLGRETSGNIRRPVKIFEGPDMTGPVVEPFNDRLESWIREMRQPEQQQSTSGDGGMSRD